MTAPSISSVVGTTHGTQEIAQTASNTQTMKVCPTTEINGRFHRLSYALQRKLDDALQTLDDAVFVPSKTLERPSPPKKSRSIYSTLAKYGIKSKESKSLVYPTYSIFHHAPTIVRLLHPDPPLLGWNPSRNLLLTSPPSSLEERSNLEPQILVRRSPLHRSLSLFPQPLSTDHHPPLRS